MKLQAKILNYLRPRAYVVNVITTGDNGSPDIFCCYRGRFVGIEVKEEGDRLSVVQNVNQVRIKRYEGFAIVARSIEDVVEFLIEINTHIDKGE